MKFQNDIPIYLQLIEIFKEKILKGEWKADEKIPSVRNLAVIYRVNPNTVQRALTELEDMGFVRSERTKGRFVQSSQKSLKSLKDDEVREITEDFIQKMRALKIKKEVVIEAIEKGWDQDD